MICADLLKVVSMALGFHQLSLILQCGIPGNPGRASIARRDDMCLGSFRPRVHFRTGRLSLRQTVTATIPPILLQGRDLGDGGAE